MDDDKWGNLKENIEEKFGILSENSEPDIMTDDVGNEKIDSKTVQLVLRPRTFMEITTDGGIWIGDFFLAPYVSIGTIIAIPAGTLFSLAIKRSIEKKKKRKTK